MTMIKAVDKPTSTLHYTPAVSISFAVLTMGVGDGRGGVANQRRYNFDSLTAALRRFDVESVSHQVHRVELVSVLASRVVSR